ncbi:MAG: VTT domain-containing protein [Oscillospiraceae bacterium]|jgi:uncharacterized membrane protein YdjX (TVP38/TMEM64 family)|nr:VTT domain-containing protein [Oscillospiraceae bacterium]
MNTNAKSNTKETVFVFLRAAVALSLFAVAIVNYEKLKSINIDHLVGSIDDLWLAAGIILGVYLLKSLVFVIPVSVIYVPVGLIFGGLAGSAVNMTGVLLEITLTFFLGRFLSGETVERRLSKTPKGRKLLAMNIQEKAWLLFLIRLLPAFPIDFVSLFYGASKRGYAKYALLSVVGLAPRVIAFTFLGSELFDWIPLDKIILIVICAIPVGVAIYLVKRLVIDRKKANSPPGDEI